MIVARELYNILDNAGAIGSFTDFYGNTQPAPKVQIGNFDESNTNLLAESERCLLFRQSGDGAGDYYVQRPVITIYIFGKAGTIGKADAIIVSDYADQLHTTLLGGGKIAKIVGINVVSYSENTNFTDSGRPWCEISVECLTDRGVKQ